MALAVLHFAPRLPSWTAALQSAASCTASCVNLHRRECSALDNRENSPLGASRTRLSGDHIIRLLTGTKRGAGFLPGVISSPRSFGGGLEFASWLGNRPVPRTCRRCRPLCAGARAANPESQLQTAEEVREQLEALQQEAEQVRGRANSARLRFMRLTHVVEQLRQRAAMDVRVGKEESARLLLIEKQKVMKALEAARQRAELLEQLAGKLNVAISMKETLLIEILYSAPLSRSEATDDTAVHHMSPKTEAVNEEIIPRGVDGDGISSRTGPNPDRDLHIEGNADHSLG